FPPSSARQRQDLFRAHANRPPAFEVGDDLFAPATGAPDFSEPGGVAHDLEADLGPRWQAESLPDPKRNRHLAFGRDPHGSSSMSLTVLTLTGFGRPVKGGTLCQRISFG